MLKKYVAALTLGLPCFAYSAQQLPLSCDISVKEFFAPLIQSRLIDTKPVSVDEHSLNQFRPKLLSRLTAFGMPVTAVFGYTDDPLLFVKNDAQATDAYGVIVKESIANVQAQLTSVGATKPRTFRVDSHSTLILCKGDLQ